MQDSPATKKAEKKKPPTSKPDPTAAITSGLKAASLSQKFVRYDLSIKFAVTVSPTGYFRDGQMRICVDFQGIGMDFENFRAETSGKTLKLFMRIPRKFIDPNRVDGELAAVLNDRDTIVSAQRETANMIYRQYGNDGYIWSPPQIVALPFEVESVIFFKPIWSDGCETLFSQLNAQSEVNGGTVPNNAVHQIVPLPACYSGSIEKAIQGSNKMAGQFNISPARC